MKYFYVDVVDCNGIEQRHIVQPLLNGGHCSFPATDDNPNMIAYLAWLAEGNEPQEWNPEESD